MTLVATGELVGAARAAGGAAVAFNVIGIEHAEAIVAGAEAAGAPVVLQISENCVRYHGAAARRSGRRRWRSRRPVACPSPCI